MDTVFDEGTAAERPYKVDGERALGPGTSDMKGGLLAGLHALAALHATGERPGRDLRGQPGRGDRLHLQHARTSVAWRLRTTSALVLECARANGDIVSARKGIADLELDLHRPRRARRRGAGEGPLARSWPRPGRWWPCTQLNGRWPGVTRERRRDRRRHAPERGAGRVPGPAGPARGHGRRLRRRRRPRWSASSRSPRRGRDRQLRRAWPTIRRWRSTPATARLAELAIAIAGELGFELHDAATGGASDANTTVRAGVPTLDGLGPIGGDDHSADEWLDLSSVVPRTTLLATLIARRRGALSAGAHRIRRSGAACRIVPSVSDDFRHRTRVEVRFRDIDAFGHVNNAVVSSYVEQARIRYLVDVLPASSRWASCR